MKNLVQLTRLVACLCISLYGQFISAQKPFSEESAFLLFLKHDTVPVENYTEEYIYRFQRDKYHLIREDEFEKRMAAKELQSQIEQLSKNTVYTLEYEAQFADYDFNRQGFIFTAMDEQTRLKVLAPALASRLTTNLNTSLLFINGAAVDLFPLAEEKANMLLKERKNYKNGKIDRRVQLRLHFTVDELLKASATERRSSGDLVCTLLKVEFLADNDLSNKPMATVTLIQDKELKEREDQLQAQKKALAKKTDAKAAKTASNSVIAEVEKLLSNSELNDELKATLIKSTIQYYEDKERVQSAALYTPKASASK